MNDRKMSSENNSLQPSWVFTVGRALLRPFLTVCFRPKVSGQHKIPKSGSVLLTSNHLGTLDTVLIPSFAPRKVQFLAKSALFKGPVRRWFFTEIGAIPVLRTTSSVAQDALESGKSVLDSESVFAIFPEGSRSTTGKLNRGRSGAAWLALNTDATVIPVGLKGTDLKRDENGKRVRVEMVFGDPLDFSDLKDLKPGAARRIATERIMGAIAALTGQELSNEFAAGSHDL